MGTEENAWVRGEWNEFHKDEVSGKKGLSLLQRAASIWLEGTALHAKSSSYSPWEVVRTSMRQTHPSRA